ncbi:MAG: ABC transporter ATP-binding protein [Bacillota bacterium]
MYGTLLRRYLLPQGRTVLLMALLLLTAIGLQLAAPRLVRSFLDRAMAGAPEPELMRLALLFLLLALSAQAVRVLAGYYSERVAWAASNRLRLDLTAHLLRLDRSFHQRRTPGELIERVDGDVSLLAAFFSTFVVEILGSALLLGGVLAALFAVHPALGLAFAGFGLLTLAALLAVRRQAAPAVAAEREMSARHYGYLGEVLTATEDLGPNGGAGYALTRFLGHLGAWLPVHTRAAVRSGLVWVLAVALFAAGDGLAYAMGGLLFRAGAVELGTVYMIVAYAALLAKPLEMLRTQLQHLQRADAAIGRIGELLALQPRLTDGSLDLPPGPLAVNFERVRFGYGEEPVLDSLSFALAPGERLGLLGRTGSGKSTIARLLARQADPVEGVVRLGGVDLREARLSSVRARVGVVTQEVELFTASLRENITLFDPSVDDRRLTTVLAELGLGEWLARLERGLDTPIAPGSLSAGEAQLLALARLFLQDPGLVILDEPSSRLDPSTGALVDRAVRRLLAGRTAVIIAHQLSTVAGADQMLFLEDGRLMKREVIS